MALYRIYNGPAPTTASQVAVTTGTAIKTLLQVKMGATTHGRIVEWGISFDGSAAATPGIIELCETDVAATVTAHVAAGIHKIDALALAAGNPTTDFFEVGTAATGYTGSAEGSITTKRQLDVQQIAPTNQFVVQRPLGREWILPPASFTRIVVKFAAAINAICYLEIEV
jgi:hypothetical protein